MKRGFDLIVSVPGIILLSPVLLAVGLLVRLTMGRPVLFRQPRSGLHGSSFTILKFRTMSEARNSDGILLPDDDRVTSLGRFLRATSLDELPELFNVARGHMSLVGPRPLRTDYLDRYSAEQMRRHQVKPGITGWTQVNGRNALNWEKKFALDVWYVDNWSLRLDLKILVMSAWKVLKGEGISAPGHTTMPEFMGTRTEGHPKLKPEATSEDAVNQ